MVVPRTRCDGCAVFHTLPPFVPSYVTPWSLFMSQYHCSYECSNAPIATTLYAIRWSRFSYIAGTKCSSRPSLDCIKHFSCKNGCIFFKKILRLWVWEHSAQEWQNGVRQNFTNTGIATWCSWTCEYSIGLLVSDLSPRRLEFGPSAVHTDYVVDKWHWEGTFSEYFSFLLSESFISNPIHLPPKM
jgi:hypothetical protein